MHVDGGLMHSAGNNMLTTPSNCLCADGQELLNNLFIKMSVTGQFVQQFSVNPFLTDYLVEF